MFYCVPSLPFSYNFRKRYQIVTMMVPNYFVSARYYFSITYFLFKLSYIFLTSSKRHKTVTLMILYYFEQAVSYYVAGTLYSCTISIIKWSYLSCLIISL